MLDPVETRIATRTQIADERMRHQGMMKRMLSRVGLTTASGTDRVSGLVDNPPVSFALGSVTGAVQGAIYGGLAWAVLVGLALPAIPITLGAAAIVIGGGAAIFALYRGVEAIGDHQAHKHDKKLADHIAEKSGAVPENALEARQQAQQESLYNLHREESFVRQDLRQIDGHRGEQRPHDEGKSWTERIGWGGGDKQHER